ncbi:replication factor-a protein [Calocera viscosa TUFC12733]|uniref:Replication protein A subunit n=1 Tax=Calocera viscosa (strain TUFC12733) TaxID=1330018 RepID=A0A167RPM6_CALVF|nr:replication factor-a protein [Calocera viscosa TUFC12733]
MDHLSPNAISRFTSAVSLDNYAPVVQVISVKKVTETRKDAPERIRLMLSDGHRFTPALLATQLTHFMVDGLLTKYCLIRITKFALGSVQEKQLLIVLALDIVKQERNTCKLGTPLSIDLHGPTFVQQEKAAPVPSKASHLNKISAKAATKGLKTVSDVKGRSTINPIDELSPYLNPWTIKARIENKSDIRTWSNARGSGQFFNVVMMDETKSIKGTAFKDVCDRMFDQVEEGRVYYISKGRIVPANRQFSKVDNKYEIIFNENTTIEPCDDEANVPEIDNTYTPLAKLQDLSKGETCIIALGPASLSRGSGALTSAYTPQLSMRDLTIVDHSGFCCRITLWGKTAEEFEVPENSIISFRTLKVEEFSGRSLSYQNGASKMRIDPDLEEAHALRGWYDAVGATQTFNLCQGASASWGTSASLNRKELTSLADVKSNNIGMNEPAEFTVKLRIKWTRREGTFWYPACKDSGCRKKVEAEGDQWRCPKCNVLWDEPEYRYIASLGAADHEEFAWFSTFNDIAEELFEMRAADLQRLKETNEPAFAKKIKIPYGKQYYFKCKAEENIVYNQSRVKYTILKAFPLNYRTEIKHLVEAIKGYDI